MTESNADQFASVLAELLRQHQRRELTAGELRFEVRQLLAPAPAGDVNLSAVQLRAVCEVLNHALDYPFGDRDDLAALLDSEAPSMANLWAAFANLAQAAHAADDPHCTCNDCIDAGRDGTAD